MMSLSMLLVLSIIALGVISVGQSIAIILLQNKVIGIQKQLTERSRR